ncbi:MAG TPA: ComEC/Rec2 family competence protein [Flavobacteriaceae bacterium]|nr:ComEC/Rec2 family competence protein [Flavobacteriaceae bacterium]
MKALNYPIIALTLIFLAGLLAGFFLRLPFGLVSRLLFIAFFLFIGIFIFQYNYKGYSRLFAFAAFVLAFIIGVFVTEFHSSKNKKNHYVNYLIDGKLNSGEKIFLHGKVMKKLNSNKYANRYILNLESLQGRPMEGKILLNVRKNSLSKSLRIDDVVFMYGNLNAISSPKNPHQFDYHAFMENRRVFGQVDSNQKEILVIRNEISLRGLAENTRQSIVASLRENGFSKNQRAMVQALLLGETNDISKETYENYKKAGVVHILSVSGLHVGFVLLIFNFLLKFLERFKYGKTLKVILLLLLMWGFALLAGFSAAVVRSVTMFSFVAVGMNAGRKTNLINVLFMSMLAILVFEPSLVFELGFQLSYLAVFSIVVFQPKIYAVYNPRTKLGKMIWGTLTVSFAAQLGIFPLILYYFHQFPGLFLLANLLIIPLVGILLGLIMVSTALAFLGILPDFVAMIVGKSIDFLNRMVAWFAGQDWFLIENIRFTLWEMWASYLVLFCAVLLLWNFTYKKLVICSLSMILLLGVFIAEKENSMKDSKFLVFYKSRKSILVQKKGKEIKVFHNLEDTHLSEEYSIKNFCAGEGAGIFSDQPLNNIYKIGQNFLLIIDSTGVYELPELCDNYVLLRDSPKINLERLIETLKPKAVIVDGSNYKSYVKRWQKTCDRKKIAFHYTGERGFFEMKF